MKDDSIAPFIVIGIIIAVVAIAVVSNENNQKRPSHSSNTVARITVKEEETSPVKPDKQKTERLIEEAQEALVELKKETGIKKNTEELCDVYKKLASICSKAVETQKNMLEAKYTTNDPSINNVSGMADIDSTTVLAEKPETQSDNVGGNKNVRE